MSQLTVFVKAVDEIDKRFAQLSMDFESLGILNSYDSVPSYSTRNAMVDELKTVQAIYDNILLTAIPLAEKLQEKMRQVDPVTGQRRYGQSSEEKFTFANEKLQSIQETIFSKLTSLTESLKRYEGTAGSLENESILPSGDLNHEDAEALAKEKGRRRVLEEEEEAARREKEENERLALLHAKAEEIRQRKAYENQNNRKFLDQIHDRIQSSLQVLNSAQDFDACLRVLKDNATPAEWKSAHSMILTILQRIVARPDDRNARRLRATHPIILQKIIQLRGGMQTLISIGFSAVIKNVEADAMKEEQTVFLWMNENRSMIAQALEESARSCDSMADMRWIIPLLQPNSNWDLFFEMEEPPIDDLLAPSASEAGSSKQTWISWFDGLQNHLKKAEEFQMSV